MEIVSVVKILDSDALSMWKHIKYYYERLRQSSFSLNIIHMLVLILVKGQCWILDISLTWTV